MLVNLALRLRRLLGHLALGISQSLFVAAYTFFDHLCYFFFSYHSLLDKPLCVDGANSRVGFDSRIHQGLGIAWLVGLVMAQPAKADEIEHYVLVKFLPVIERYLEDAICSLRVVAVNV